MSSSAASSSTDGQGPHHFSKSEIAFAESVAGATSQALQAARLFEQQRRIAVTLQENLIHPRPRWRVSS